LSTRFTPSRPELRSAVPTIDLTDDELAAVTAAIRRTIETDRISSRPAPGSFARGAGTAPGGGEAEFCQNRQNWRPGGKNPEAHPGPEGPAASQSRQAGAAITAGPRLAGRAGNAHGIRLVQLVSSPRPAS
jgi:hypothetical protein